MSTLFHSFANWVVALFMKLLFGSVARVHVIRPENPNRGGGLLLASNHISHFDPFILSAVVRRKIDWMTMAEFFPIPVLGQLLRAVDAFPADRHRANRATVRAAIERLRAGRIVGIFPEGGIRDGKNSLLEGAATRSGVAGLSHIAGAPVLPCVILGSDRLYNKKRWLPLRQTPIWIAFGNPIVHTEETNRLVAREEIERELAAAMTQLSRELQATFGLVQDDLPQPPQQRMRE